MSTLKWTLGPLALAGVAFLLPMHASAGQGAAPACGASPAAASAATTASSMTTALAAPHTTRASIEQTFTTPAPAALGSGAGLPATGGRSSEWLVIAGILLAAGLGVRWWSRRPAGPRHRQG